jgi:hypothetical protein
MTTRAAARHRRDGGAAGVEGNEKLTAMTGAVLLVGFLIEGVTIVELHKLLVLHFVVGALLIGPVLLKIASTGYRFVRYYRGSLPYVRKGPPAPVLRVLGPLVTVTSVAVLATGVILAVIGPGNEQWLFLHKVSFVLWFGVTTVHVVSYAPRLPRLLAGRPSRVNRAGVPGVVARGTAVPGGAARWLALLASLIVGVGAAVITMYMSGKWGMSL